MFIVDVFLGACRSGNIGWNGVNYPETYSCSLQRREMCAVGVGVGVGIVYDYSYTIPY